MSLPDWGIKTVAQQQANPEITINEALFQLFLKSEPGVLGLTNTPPGSPVEGDCYICGTSPTGAWAGRANCITGYFNGAWMFLPDRNTAGTIITMGTRHEGLSAYRMDTNVLTRWTGAAWA